MYDLDPVCAGCVGLGGCPGPAPPRGAAPPSLALCGRSECWAAAGRPRWTLSLSCNLSVSSVPFTPLRALGYTKVFLVCFSTLRPFNYSWRASVYLPTTVMGYSIYDFKGSLPLVSSFFHHLFIILLISLLVAPMCLPHLPFSLLQGHYLFFMCIYDICI